MVHPLSHDAWVALYDRACRYAAYELSDPLTPDDVARLLAQLDIQTDLNRQLIARRPAAAAPDTP